MPNCKTIAICNQKGGVGKTTTTVNSGVLKKMAAHVSSHQVHFRSGNGVVCVKTTPNCKFFI